jgi:acyl-CoA thioesterase
VTPDSSALGRRDNPEAPRTPRDEQADEHADEQEVARRCADLMWADDVASQGMGMEIVEVAPGRAVVRMTVRADMANGHGIAHGGFTFTLADSAFAFACNSRNRRTVAQGCDISFLRPVQAGEVLVADATERWREGRSGIYDVTVRSGDRVVAEFRGRSREVGGSLVAEDTFEETDGD